MQKLIRNAVRCKHCGDMIESKYRHDFVSCSCGCCSVDGGLDYIRRGFLHSRDEDYIELSEYEGGIPVHVERTDRQRSRAAKLCDYLKE